MALTSDGKLYGWGWNKVNNVLPFAFFYLDVISQDCMEHHLSSTHSIEVSLQLLLCMHLDSILSKKKNDETCNPYSVSLVAHLEQDNLLIFCLLSMQFGQVGVGDNIDQCSPVQVRFPDDQACYLSYIDTPTKI